MNTGNYGKFLEDAVAYGKAIGTWVVILSFREDIHICRLFCIYSSLAETKLLAFNRIVSSNIHFDLSSIPLLTGGPLL